MALSVGALLGRYEILGPLGSGGMGDVYRARDTRLDRVVAIKVANERFGERFEREARAIAQLNHPHICTLHDVGPDYLVMELVEGETLAARLHRSAMHPPEALRLAAQIADGLAAAHAAGIVHRDLKPQNVMITPNGAKILDFGLAKAPQDITQTATGAVIGTLAYMPPEQREGRATDARTDHYALGLVLLEMLTGVRPDPEQPRMPEGLAPVAERALSRCLARNPEERWQSARDLSSVLGLASTSVSSPSKEAGSQPSKRWLGVAAALVLGVAAVAAVAWPRPSPPADPIRLTIPPPPGTSFLTVQQGGPPAVSPDGRAVAFVAQGPDGRHLWVRSLDDFDARRLPGTAGAVYPGWSPDGRSLTFSESNSLKRVELDGREPRVLFAGTPLAGPASWSTTNRVLWSNAGELYVIDAAGGERVAVTARDSERFEENHYSPTFLPDNRHYLFLIRGGLELQFDLCVGEIGSKEHRVLLTGVTAARYAPAGAGTDGWLFFVRDGRLLAQPFSADRQELRGEARPIADDVAVHGFGIIGDFGVSAAGVIAFRRADSGVHELAWFDRSGRQVGGIGDRPGNRRNNVRLSPDGNSVAFTRQANGVQDVWIHDFVRNVTSRFTFDGGRAPVWSPDGSEIAYLHQDTIVRKSVVGGATTPIWTGPGILSLNDWSGDGRHFLLTRWDPKAGREGRGLWMISNVPNTSTFGEPVFVEPGALHAQFAPATGAPRWIAFDAPPAPGHSYVRTLPGEGNGRWQVSVEAGNAVRWRRDGGELFFISNQSFMAVDVEASATFRPSAPRLLFVTPGALRTAMSQYALGYDVAADGRRFITTFPGPETPASVINVIINWQSALLEK